MPDTERPAPVTCPVPWNHEDPEIRLIIAIQSLAEKSLLGDDDLARVFDYLAARAKGEGFRETRIRL